MKKLINNAVLIIAIIVIIVLGAQKLKNEDTIKVQRHTVDSIAQQYNILCARKIEFPVKVLSVKPDEDYETVTYTVIDSRNNTFFLRDQYGVFTTGDMIDTKQTIERK